jgi:hypothetical protein
MPNCSPLTLSNDVLPTMTYLFRPLPKMRWTNFTFLVEIYPSVYKCNCIASQITKLTTFSSGAPTANAPKIDSRPCCAFYQSIMGDVQDKLI